METLLIEESEIKKTLGAIFNSPKLTEKEKNFLMANPWKIYYRVKPPTIEEFLTEEWIGPTAKSIFPHVEEILKEYWAPDSEKNHLLLGMAIGTGKSLTSTLASLYLTTHLWCMKDPKKFFGLSQATTIVQALISFTMDKAQQLLLQPFYQILLSSPKFKRVKQEENLDKIQKDNPDLICWTSAGKMGVLQFYNDIHYVLASSPSQLLGLNLILVIMSEISFFIDKGFSTEYIWRVYQDSRARVWSRFKGHYFSGTIIDSSPNDIELSPIDKYIFHGEAAKDKNNLILTGSQWKFLPEKFPIWYKSGETFPVFRGSNGEPARMLDLSEVKKYNSEEIFDVPIDLEQFFIDNIIKNVKDYCGWPSGSQGMLVRDDSIIEDMFVDLKNIYTYIKAPSGEAAKNLIWDIIQPQFFIRHHDKYEFYNNPKEKRFIHVDLAETKDIASLSCVHPQLTLSGETVYITDFNIPISPEKTGINLEAIKYFIMDLRNKGRMKIDTVTFDQYQSSPIISYLKERNFNVYKISPDADPKIYLTYVSLLQSGKIKAGKNIFLKNNIKSLQEIRLNSGRKKIEHTKGKIIYEDGANWELSGMGKFAKDVTDSHAGAVWNCIYSYKGVPIKIWQDNELEGEEFSDYLKMKLKNELINKYGVQVL